jgi:hypothetical protein
VEGSAAALQNKAEFDVVDDIWIQPQNELMLQVRGVVCMYRYGGRWSAWSLENVLLGYSNNNDVPCVASARVLSHSYDWRGSIKKHQRRMNIHVCGRGL